LFTQIGVLLKFLHFHKKKVNFNLYEVFCHPDLIVRYNTISPKENFPRSGLSIIDQCKRNSLFRVADKLLFFQDTETSVKEGFLQLNWIKFLILFGLKRIRIHKQNKPVK
jgi:hypothetical protein